jgi:hypothetical protein
MYLKSADPDFDANEIKDAFEALHSECAGDGVDAFFEHGQWWICCIGSGAIFSVVDAEGSANVCDGLSFEMIEAGDTEY